MEDQKKQVRPVITSILLNKESKNEEVFQNRILRPIIKLQHDFILRYFKDYIDNHKVNIEQMDLNKKKKYLEKTLKNENRLKIELRSFITGLLTLDELNDYLKIKSELNKRINSMIQQKIMTYYQV